MTDIITDLRRLIADLEEHAVSKWAAPEARDTFSACASCVRVIVDKHSTVQNDLEACRRVARKIQAELNEQPPPHRR